MTKGVYLGDSGTIQIRRSGDGSPLAAVLNPADVNVSAKRFSFDFDTSALIAGDRIQIERVGGGNLELVAGVNSKGWGGHIHVDDVGGIRLYSTFADAINGGLEDALPLVLPSVDQSIQVSLDDTRFRYVARVTSYEITTSRETIDQTSLGENYREQFASGLISGQGQLTCFWDYQADLCEGIDGRATEFPNYLAQLVLRMKQGASFYGRFFLVDAAPTAVWYDVPTCVVSNVAVSVSPTAAITTQVQFLTSGPIKLRIGGSPGFIEQESNDLLLQEDGDKLATEAA